MDKIEFNLSAQDPSSEDTSSEETEIMTARSRTPYGCHPLLSVSDAHCVRNVTPPVQGKNSLAGFWNSETSETTHSKSTYNTQGLGLGQGLVLGQGQGLQLTENQFQRQQNIYDGTTL
jgi:hypothetical protein